jgi:hypothetical protein
MVSCRRRTSEWDAMMSGMSGRGTCRGGWALSLGRIEDWENGFFLGADDEVDGPGDDVTTRVVV